jgi:hypothetical protein
MNKSRFLTTIIIGLLVSNGILLFMFFNGPKSNKEPKSIIIDKLNFDKEQIKQYDVYIVQHRKAINENETAIKILRSNLYTQLKYKLDTTKIDSLIGFIARQQGAVEHINYKHFIEIKNLCKPSQEKDFNELTNEIVSLFSSKERK